MRTKSENDLSLNKKKSTTLQKNPPLFKLKLMYSYVIEVADSESDLVLYGTNLISEIFALLPPSKNALGRPGRRGHVHLDQIF